MNLKSKNGLLLLEKEFFHSKDIFTCGQAFHWVEEEDGSFTTIHRGRILNLREKFGKIIIEGAGLQEFEDFWWAYFDLEKDYGKLRDSLPNYDYLIRAMNFGKGIRILNQDPFETIITFIISAMNNIKRIQASVFSLSNRYGEKMDHYKGRDWYSFPEPRKLKLIAPEELRKYCGTGFRDIRIVEASRRIDEGDFNLDPLGRNREEMKKDLMTFPGIGPKVADCINLFAYDFLDTFPVDVWIKRLMEEEFSCKNLKNNEIELEGRRLFGDLAGLAQQYIFYYGRELA